MSTGSLLALDVGNTRVKAAWFSDGRLTEYSACLHDDAAALLERLTERAKRRVERREIALASVQPARADWLCRRLAERAMTPRWRLQSDGGIFHSGRIRHQLQTPASVGVDRVLATLGGRARFPQHDIFVVDCGSAITLSVMTREDCFLGGAIFPGLRMMAASLHQGTAQLPEIALDQRPDPPGRSTAEAIQLGILEAAAGGIDRLIAAHVKLSDAPRVILTGGDAPAIGPLLTQPHESAATLVVEGIQRFVELHPEGTGHVG